MASPSTPLSFPLPPSLSTHPTQVSLIATANSFQAYTTTHFTQRVYALSTTTPLSARTFGTWTFLSAIIRFYAAYDIQNPALYQLALCSYLVAMMHFVSEWFVFGTARWGKGLAGPVFVSVGSVVWMVMQWGFYVR